ncbi:MAG TPA: IPT/TIG domain-containing protein, partial [Acidimicrobiales bacterium]|nr:IPT/TIG domain-containing protein [Acidimicrobiales bacterium]
ATPTKPDVSVDDPASQAYVVGVGGTTLVSPTIPPNQKVWNDGAEGGGGGGGISSTWPSPGWQSRSNVAGVTNTYSKSASYAFCVPAAKLAKSYAQPPCREVPDVTIDADEDTGTSFYEALYGGWSTIGGTSTAAPMWAAITADISASSVCSGLTVNATNDERDLGFVSPALYEGAAAAKPGADFTDVTKGNNDIFGLGKGYPATTGYDMASGLGSPVVTSGGAVKSGLTSALCSLLSASNVPVSVTSLSPQAGPATGGNAVTVAGKGFAGSGVSVLAVTFGQRPAKSFKVLANGSISAVAPPAAPVPGTAGESAETPMPVDVTVTVKTSAGVRTSRPTTATSRYIYVASNGGKLLPSVSGVGPSGGLSSGGNTVDVYGSGFKVEGPISSVTFGAVKGTNVRVLSDYELEVTVPGQSKATKCSEGTGFEPADVCQVQVVVTGAHGASPRSTILPAMTGKMVFSSAGIVVPAKGTEVDPAPSEYDYAPAPVISSISPNPYSEAGGKPITIDGSGFSVLTLEWVNVGLASSWLNEQPAFNYVSGSEIQISWQFPKVSAPTSLKGGISVQTVSGLSKSEAFTYEP